VIRGSAFHPIVILSLAAACASERGTENAFAVRDSANVRILELTVDPWREGSTLRFSAAPLLQIGVQSGDSTNELYRVNGARRLSDGSMAVSTSSTNDIRIFNAHGQIVRRVGRPGQGPGEFIALGGFEVLWGDTLLAIDFGRQALMAFAVDGSFAWIRSFVTGNCSWIAEEWPVRFRLDDGGFLIVCEDDDVSPRIRSGQTVVGTTDRSTALVLTFPVDGSGADTIISLPGIEYGIIDAGRGPGTMYPPYGRRLVYSLTSDGLFIGNQERFEIREYSSNGELETVLRGPSVDLAITAADLERMRSALTARTRTDDPEAVPIH
jgi:hypothetical protein